MRSPLLGGLDSEGDESESALLGADAFSGGPNFERFLVLVKVRRRWILLWWALVSFVSLFFAPRLMQFGNDKMDPPKGSTADIAQKTFEQRFGEDATGIPVIILVERIDGLSGMKLPELAYFSQALEAKVLEYNLTNNNVKSFMSWYKYNGTTLDAIKHSFMSSSGKSTFVNIIVRANNETSFRQRFAKDLGWETQKLNPDPERFNIGVTGLDAMHGSNVDDSKDEILQVDAITVPIAILILGRMIGSWRLLLITIVNMTVAILTSFSVIVIAIDYGGAWKPEGTTPQLMEVISLALSIDYGLFLLRRFRDELKQGATSSQAIYLTMLRAGHVVFMSGITLILVMVAFALVPNATIRMDGLCCTVGIASCVLVNLTLTPALLYEFSAFFSTFDGCCTQRLDHGEEASACTDLDAITLNDQLSPSFSEEAGSFYHRIPNGPVTVSTHAPRGVHPRYKTVRFRITRIVTTYPCNLISIIALYVLVVPLALQVFRINLDQNILNVLPRSGEATNRLLRMFEEYPGGNFAPFQVMVTLPPSERGQILYSEVAFRAAHRVAEKIVNQTECTESSITSPAWVSGTHVYPIEAEILLGIAELFCDDAKNSHFRFENFTLDAPCRIPKQYEFLWEKSVNAERNSFLLHIVVPFFPFSETSRTFIAQVRHILKDTEAELNKPGIDPKDTVKLYLTGFEVGPSEIEGAVYAVFPTMITVSMLSIFATLGILLNSYFAPIRLALTLFMPLASVFGLAVLVYQDGILDWTGIQAVTSSGGFFWSIPVMILTMIAGLVLDYDLFLITRIQEHRSKGYHIQAAICKSACTVGPTISAAGAIMVAVFVGLMLSDQTLLNQCGWLLSTSIIIDTLIVNTILVPALVSLGDGVAWQPAKMPLRNLVTLESPEFTDLTM